MVGYDETDSWGEAQNTGEILALDLIGRRAA
jgi:hypothetical protein